MLRRMNAAVSTIMLGLAVLTAHCQVSTATIAGVVQDSGGAVIPGASVVLTQTETNATAQVTSNERGAFSLPALPVGPYAMSVTSPGFSGYKRTNIVLTVGQVANFEVALAVGVTSETLTVTSGARHSLTKPIRPSKLLSINRRW
jgi:hypothetical protein